MTIPLAPAPAAPRPARPAAAPSARPALQPYRVLFPLGLLAALAGSGVWPLAWSGALGWPGPLHRDLMMPGFEQCFISGFLLTAMPAFTHGPKCTRAELALAAALALATLAAAFAGLPALVAGGQLASVLLLFAAVGGRLVRSRQLPPEEFAFVGFGLAAGALGASLRLAGATGAALDLPARFPERLVSLGMVLSLVVGLGSLLVPAFAGMPRPLALPLVAGPHERRGRRGFYLVLVAMLALSFFADGARIARFGPLLRAATVTIMLMMGWKIFRLPGHRTLHAHALWASGWAVLAGLWMAALLPAHELAGLHVVFIGGFALLTLSIGTRVVVAHGRHPLEEEPRVLSPLVVALLAAALALRLAAEFDPARATMWLGASGAAGLAMWVSWGARVVALLAREKPQAPPAIPVIQR